MFLLTQRYLTLTSWLVSDAGGDWHPELLRIVRGLPRKESMEKTAAVAPCYFTTPQPKRLWRLLQMRSSLRLRGCPLLRGRRDRGGLLCLGRKFARVGRRPWSCGDGLPVRVPRCCFVRGVLHTALSIGRLGFSGEPQAGRRRSGGFGFISYSSRNAIAHGDFARVRRKL